MYFILSKVLLFLIYPVIWVFILLFISLAVCDRRRKQWLLATTIILLYIFSAPLFINWVAGAWSVAPSVKKSKVYSCAIVLGGFSSEGKNGLGHFNISADRFIQGIKAIRAGLATHILITSGSADLLPGSFREATWVKTQLDSLKIPDSCILIESKSRNTIENAQLSKVMLQKAGLKPPYLLITSDFHMRRAAMIFRKQGYDVDLYPANYMDGNGAFSYADLIPDGNAISGWNLYIKEMVGYVVDKWK